jgi:hypothetical protein
MVKKNTPVPTEFTGQPMATPKQVQWIKTCRAEKDLSSLSAEQIAFIDDKIANGITKRKASELLDKLFALPRKPVERAAIVTDRAAAASPFVKAPAVANGRYALRNDDNPENAIEFYSVFNFDDGGVSLKRHASDERHQVRGASNRNRILMAIAVDPIGAAKLYGTETEHCGRCAKELTRTVSREFGLGPDCAEALGVSGAYETLAEQIRSEGRDPNATEES